MFVVADVSEITGQNTLLLFIYCTSNSIKNKQRLRVEVNALCLCGYDLFRPHKR